MEPQKIVFKPASYCEKGKPFHADILGRKPFAIRLTNYIDALNTGAVIAIDAPWGEGKTWFGRNWEALLNEKGYKTAYYDAFLHDHNDDPFLSIAASLSGVVDASGAEAIKSGAIEIAKRSAAPIAAGILNVIAPGVGTLTERFFDEYLAEKYEGYERQEKSLEAFKAKLADAVKGEKPTVVFIDELDRCRPSYAVGVIEKIKHFFSVENLIFVLLINKEQLDAYVNGVYGEKVNSALYLSKFINMTFRMPQQFMLDGARTTNAEKYISEVFNKLYSPEAIRKSERFADHLAFLANVVPLSLRDIEKAVSYYVAADDKKYGEIYAYLISLKCVDSILFAGVSERHAEYSKEAISFHEGLVVNARRRKSQDWQEKYLVAMRALIESHVDDYAIPSEPKRYFLDRNINPARAPQHVFDRLNVDLDEY